MKILTTHAVIAASVGVAALAWTTGMAQMPPPPPPPSGSQPGSYFGGSTSSGSYDTGSGSGSWLQFNGFNFSGSGSGWDWNSTYNSNNSIEFTTDMDGEAINVRAWHKYYFDINQGFTTGAQSSVNPWVGNGTNATYHRPQDEPQVVIQPGQCPHRFCIYVVFESDYGAIDTFDSFVMDRFEASTLMGSDQWSPNGPVPLILGRMTRQEQASWGMTTNSSGLSGNSYTQGFNGTNSTNGMNPSNGPFLWNDPRRTVWTLYPLDNFTNQVDLVMSFKQLYTLLPEYSGPLHSNGPFYSADLTDQLILRLTAGIPSEFSAMSSVLPLVVDHIGNKLVDVSYSSEILYPGLGFHGGNELQLNLKIQRRRFRALEPWLPARSSSECRVCDQQLPRGFKKCFDSKVGLSQTNGTGSARAVWEDLLHFGNDRLSFNAEPYGEVCFEEIMDGQWRNISESGSNNPDFLSTTTAAQLLAKTDAGLRCMVETQCPISGPGQKNDGRVVTMNRQPARTQIHFEDPNYTLYLNLATTDELQDTHTTQVFSGNTPASMLKDIILSAIPGVQEWNIDLEVRKYDNLAEIAKIEAENARLQALYGNATIWAGSASDGSYDGSDEMGSGSGMMGPSPSPSPFPSPSPSSNSSPSPSPPGPPPPGPGRRRRLMGVSSDGSSDAGSSSESDPRAPKPPQLVPVPKPRYSIELFSHNVTLGIQVIDVFTSFPVQWESSRPSLTFDVTNMRMNKFVYNPPPQGLNLEWRDPFTNPVKDPFNSSQQLPMIPPGDACSECMGAYMDCLLDTDCAYGVRTYLWGALQPFLYESGNQTHTTHTQGTPQSPALLEADMTEVFRTARAYFPSRAYDKLSRYLTCLAKPRPATNLCNIDGVHRVMDPRNGSWFDRQGMTSLRLIPARVEITMNKGSLLSFSVGNFNSSWYEDGTVSGLRNALLNSVFRQAQNNSFAFHLNVSQRSTEDSNVNKVVYSLMFNDYMGDIPRFTTIGSDSIVMAWPWEIVFEAMDDYLLQGPQGVVHWNRLMDWLKVFTWYDLSGGGSNGAGNPNGNPTWTPPPPQASHAICPQCSAKLTACLSNNDCANALRTRVSTDLNPSVLSSLNPPNNDPSQAPPTIQEGNIYRTKLSSIYEQWQTSMSSSTFNQIDSLIQCLADSLCPVGYSMNGTTATYPTSIEYFMVKQFSRPWGASSPITLTYFDPALPNREVVTRQITYTSEFDQFFGEVHHNYDTDLHYTVYPAPDGSPHDIITIEGTPSRMNLLQITVAPDRTSSRISFVSLFPVRTTWSFLFEWFSIAPSNGTNPSFVPPPLNTDPCFQCQDKIHNCQINGDCWQSIQQVILPTLRGNRGMLNTSPYFNGSQTFTRKDFGALLRVQPEIQSHNAFSTPGAFDDFIDILQCLEQVQCDVSYAEGATASPATAHNPTYLDVQSESVVLTLYMNTDLILDFDGVVTTYTEQGTGNPDALRMFLNNALGGNVAFIISEFRSDASGYHYTIRFPHFYSNGQAPTLQIGTNWGQTNGNPPPVASRLPWNIYFQSYLTVPGWFKLTDLLSIGSSSSSTNTNTNGTMAGYRCDACSTALTECWNDFSCQYMLTTSALPMMNTYMDTLMMFNSTENLFQVDFSNQLLYNILPVATIVETKDRFFNLLECHARSPCVTESVQPVAPFEWVDLTVKPARSRMQVPIGGSFTISYRGHSFQYQDSDNTAALVQLLESQVLMHPSSMVEIERTMGGSPGFATYLVSYFYLYDVSLPHFEWSGSTGGSQDTPVQFVFKSTTPHVKEVLTSWMMGLQHGP